MQGDILLRGGRRQDARTRYGLALTAWNELPPKRRNTYSMLKLHEAVATSLEELDRDDTP
jgi:predicted negative regulator of RcsB-dependent stress response